ncbi:high-affinity zinc uptake system protein ZnuA [Nitrospirillum viridazoti Y2]|uniref:High-affinity zinc uptake system protein ZnuA n=1 Tax=Nitrospirillum amazonense TaxID=28077 RepID=A0A560HST9_9PROT|nr:zinc ABC transporter substrate-binding protein [Nitrospirillum amazonense]EGY00704.1 high-affinity zinc uptake system protein ZnuA [Nitrospirillum amazonense Y2]TWB49673.1 zinc transport system substrate-binding protein [Nitrospirillum amazonense]
MSPFRILSLVALLWLAFTAPSRADAPRVVASVKPVHSLAAALMQGVGQGGNNPKLLVDGTASPHSFSLKPSDASALSQADIVFWMGPTLEPFLVKPLASLARGAHIVTLIEAPGLHPLALRSAGAWADGDSNQDGHPHLLPAVVGGAADNQIDGHAWLDPTNAKAMARAMADALIQHDPADAARYRDNLAALLRSLDALDAEIGAILAPVSAKPFVVFHDAFHYLEARYRLDGVGAITLNPEVRPGAARLSQLRARIQASGATCVFAEPQFETALIGTLVDGTQAKRGVLDPEGALLPAGPDLYATLMRANAHALAGCLGG